MKNFLNQQCENVSEPGSESETFPFLEGRSASGAISVRLSNRVSPRTLRGFCCLLIISVQLYVEVLSSVHNDYTVLN